MLTVPSVRDPQSSYVRLGYPIHVVTDPLRCMQCGICSFSCPAGIDVRNYAWQGLPVDDSRCLTCGQCVLRCPRRAFVSSPWSDRARATR